MSSRTNIGFLLIHGFTGTHHEMQPLADFLTKEGYSVKNITLPGHETSEEDLITKKWKDFTDYAQKKLDKIKEKYEKVFVCGLSMGGAISLYLGATNPDIDGIIPMAAVCKPPDRRMYFLALPYVHLIYPKYRSTESGWEDLEALETHKSYENYPIKSVSQLFWMIREVKKLTKEIEVPILVVYSKKDLSVPKKQAEWIFNNVQSEDKEIAEITKGGHVIPKDAGRFQLFEAIKKWLEKRE
jgi:carboxylesterase